MASRLAKGAVVGSGSVVRQDVKEYTLVAGVPATEVRNSGASDTQSYRRGDN
jgi:acetyltransferase-like isoleucine patch superfamily enzyme